MSVIDPAEWETNEWPCAPGHAPARPEARPAPGKLPLTAQAKAIASINERYRSDLNDEVGF